MANAPNGIEILPKTSIAGVWCTNVTDRRQTDGRLHLAKKLSATTLLLLLQLLLLLLIWEYSVFFIITRIYGFIATSLLYIAIYARAVYNCYCYCYNNKCKLYSIYDLKIFKQLYRSHVFFIGLM